MLATSHRPPDNGAVETMRATSFVLVSRITQQKDDRAAANLGAKRKDVHEQKSHGNHVQLLRWSEISCMWTWARHCKIHVALSEFCWSHMDVHVGVADHMTVTWMWAGLI